MSSQEVFKEVKTYNKANFKTGVYEVTSWGRVFNKNTNMFLTPQKDRKQYPYLRVNLFDENGRKVHCKLHRLVANAFIPNADNKPEVNHKDGNTFNNSVTNLEWVSHEQNVRKAHEQDYSAQPVLFKN